MTQINGDMSNTEALSVAVAVIMDS